MKKRILAAFVLLVGLAIYCFAALPVSQSYGASNQNPIPYFTIITGNIRATSTSSAGAYGDGGASYTDCAGYWNADSFANDQYATITIKTVNTQADMWMGPGVRMSGTNLATMSGYVLYIGYASAAGHDRAQLYLRQNGNWTTMLAHDAATVPAVGDVYEIHVNGNSITTKRNGVAYLSGTDSTLTSGSAGMFF